MWSSILKKSLSKLEGRIVRSNLKFTPSSSLDLGLRVLVQVLVLAYGTTRLSEIPSESMLSMDPIDSVGRLSNPPQSIVYTSGFILRLDSIELQVLSTGI